LAAGRHFHSDEYPQRNLPVISTQITIPKPRKPLRIRIIPVPSGNSSDSGSSKEIVEQVDVETQMNDDSQTVIEELKELIMRIEEDIYSCFKVLH